MNNLEMFCKHQGMFWSSRSRFFRKEFRSVPSDWMVFRQEGLWCCSEREPENHPKLKVFKMPRFNIYTFFFFFYPFWLFDQKSHSKSNALYYSLSVMSLKIYILERECIKHFTLAFCGFWNHWHKRKHFCLKQSKW